MACAAPLKGIRSWVVLIAAVLAFAVPTVAQAHFQLKANIRIVHVRHDLNGLRVYLRVPTPLLIASFPETQWDGQGNVVSAPYTVRGSSGEEAVFLFDFDRLDEDPEAFASIVGNMLLFRIDGQDVDATVERFRIRSIDDVVKFSTPADARKALDGPAFPANRGALPVGETVTDVELHVPWDDFVASYEFMIPVVTGLAGEERVETVLIDHYGGESRRFRWTGALAEPIVVTQGDEAVSTPEITLADAARRFVPSGIRHILSGIDHVIFVLCLVVGATALGNLVWRVTGFTLGHTVTLVAGFFGITLSGAWFIPAVETAIALSIIYAGVIAIMNRPGGATFVITASIGLFHGFGFSFVLREVLQVDADWLWASLLSFNLGIEIGQLGIVVVVWSLLRMMDRWSIRWARMARVGIATGAIGVAGYWAIERGYALLLLT